MEIKIDKNNPMYEKLYKLLDNSYCPYSNFRVSCIIVMKDGTEIKGVNVENAAYGSSICAERSAIVSAISNGYKPYDFKAMYCMVKNCNPKATNKEIGSSCGACRQVIGELFEKDALCYFINIHGKTLICTVEELLPFSFSSEILEIKQ